MRKIHANRFWGPLLWILGTGLFGLLLWGVYSYSLAPNQQPPVWPAPTGTAVESNARAAGTQILPQEGTRLHIHAHLTVTFNGEPVTVPAHIGIDTQRGLYAELHTHDTSGIIHVESARRTAQFTLGQFFREWHVELGAHTIGDYTDRTDNALVSVWVNQQRYQDPLSTLTLTNHQDIDIAITTDGQTPRQPKPFTWPHGY